MSEDEVEKFEVSDYDLETEFNPNRFRKPITKNQHIYGTNELQKCFIMSFKLSVKSKHDRNIRFDS